jgi:6-phosphofructokinase 1
VLVPELIFNEQKFLAQVEQIYRQKGCVLVVASEGLRDGQGRFLAELQQGTEIGKDVNGQALLSIGEGVSGYLCNLVRRESGLKARYDKPGTLQRGSACRSSVDLDEAFSVGRKAGAYLMEGQDSVMPALKRVSDEPYKCEIEPVLLSEIAGREKRLPSDFFEDDGLSEAKVRAYAGPLIGPALEEPFRF